MSIKYCWSRECECVYNLIMKFTNVLLFRPFYGFHEKEVHFLKIYLYHPGLIKRAANLLLNGAIMNKSFQPHESHIPYILQFMIDHNLYGMSQVFVPQELIIHRKENSSETDALQKLTLSSIEFDMMAVHILNRALLYQKNDINCVNPGIASLWEDEKIRRGCNTTSELEPPLSQIREYVKLSRSDEYFREILKLKLSERPLSDTIIEDQMNSTAEMERLIVMDCEANEVEPQSKSQKSKSSQSGSLFSSSGSERHDENEDQSNDLDRTIVNEELVMNLTQNPLNVTLQEEDYELLRIMKELEENEGQALDDDSALAQCSQLPRAETNENNKIFTQVKDIEEEDEDELDFTMMNFDPDFDEDESDDFASKTRNKDLTTALENLTANFPQFDGGYDLRSTKSGSDNRTKNISMQNKTWFNKNQPPKLQELKIIVEKLKSNEILSSLNCTPTNNGIKKEENSNIFSFDTDFLNKIITSPIPGPSGVQKTHNFSTAHVTPDKFQSHVSHESDESEDDPLIQSFYDRTLMFDASIIFSSDSDFNDDNLSIEPQKDEKIVICPKCEPPSVDEVQKSMFEFYEAKKPVYKDFNDVTKKREVGHNILHITGDCLKACPSFESEVLEINNQGSIINELRREKYKDITGTQKNLPSIEKINEYLIKDDVVILDTIHKPPTVNEAKRWVKARQNQSDDNKEIFERPKNIEDDSPAKAKLEKPMNVMIPEKDDDLDTSVIDSSLNESSFSASIEMSDRKRKQEKFAFNVSSKSPLSLILDEENTNLDNQRSATPNTSRNSLSYIRRRKRSRLSLSKKLHIQRAIAESPDLGVSILNDDSSPATSQTSQSSNQSNDTSEIRNSVESATSRLNLNSTYGFSLTSTDASILDKSQHFKVDLENLKTANAKCEYTFLTVINLELHVQTRADLKPDPIMDSITALFYTIHNDVPENVSISQSKTGMIVYGLSELEINIFKRSDLKADILVVTSETALFEHFIELVRHWDPDIFAGYEIERSSWGYLIDRGNVLDFDMVSLLSRILPQDYRRGNKEMPQNFEENPGQDREYESDIQIRGRILLNVWRLIRHEIALTSYTFENVMYHIMHQRCALHSFKFFTNCWNNPKTMWIVADYYLSKIRGTFAILDTLDLIGRTCELAKLFGIQFYEVLSRGSQFRVESMMMRIAKARNYVGVSPSVQQRAYMRAPEYLPLILEPQSRLFTDPLIVLDFQSLYPSVIIGYNYCFSTCLGRVEHLGTKDEFEFGATKLKISPDILDQLVEQNQITISPCGVAFVTPDVRKGVLPQMLKEILDTRLMVKQSMKIHKTNKVLQRVLHSRQLGLKLIANVTYGYTAANFSGRMPCVEVGDSVVSKGRETLERAIKFVEANKEWRAEVVYGDTDSLFILLPGRDRASAFIIGQEIAEAVTEDNPTPIKLKFEKVYQPCILQTKKRYVGYMYETPDQIDPIYEAKGIETVRRDGCPIVAKTLEKTLRILFETLDVSAVKRYINRQFTKILRDEISIQDLIFAKEFRGMNGYKPGACVPAMELTKKWILKDPRNIPLSGERVPFVIANGPPGLPLIRLVRSPHELLADKALKINSFYYITKVLVPPLNRCLLLIGADVREWLSDLPRITKLTGATTTTDGSLVNFNYKKSTIAQYFATTNCIVECGNQTVKPGFCTECLSNPQKSVVKLTSNMMMLDRKMHQIEKICQSCCARSIHYECISLDCPVLYKLNTSKHNFTQIETLREFLETEFF
uniref:DNA polymerase n=1 Tax=Culicoides sonorensis TaxID=179676 RepID=A0A336LYV6_CULSO